MSSRDDENKILFLLTYGYPFNIGEEHLEDEMDYLADSFTEIQLICLGDQPVRTRKVPANVAVTKFPEKKGLWETCRLLLITNWLDVWEEFKSISFRYKLQPSSNVLKTGLASYLRALGISRFISKHLKQTDGQRVFMYSYWNDVSALAIAMVKKRHPQVIAVSRAHRYEVYAEQNKLNYLAFTFFKFRFLDAVFFVAEDGRNYTLKQFPFIDPQKLKVGRLGVEVFPAIPTKRNEKKLVVFSISYFLKVKRVSLIAESLALIHDIEIEWLHIGEGFSDVASYNEQINQILKDRPNIKYDLLGNMPKSEVISFLQHQYVDLLINVSTSEGLPVSMMEAMSCSIPVVATDVGGVADIVTDQFNGFLIPENSNPQDIADCIRSYHLLPDAVKEKFRINAFNTWKEKFNADINFPAFVKEVLSL